MPAKIEGVSIAGSGGAVVHRGRLTVVIGEATTPFAGDSEIPTATLRVTDELAAGGTWSFEEVATTLQNLVVDYAPPGLAALLELDDEPMLFLFDQGQAIELDTAGAIKTEHQGEGRASWTTRIVTGPSVRIGLRGAPNSKGWSVLRGGAVLGSTALIQLATAPTGAMQPGIFQPVSDDRSDNHLEPDAGDDHMDSNNHLDPVTPAMAGDEPAPGIPNENPFTSPPTLAIDPSEIGATRFDPHRPATAPSFDPPPAHPPAQTPDNTPSSAKPVFAFETGQVDSPPHPPGPTGPPIDAPPPPGFAGDPPPPPAGLDNPAPSMGFEPPPAGLSDLPPPPSSFDDATTSPGGDDTALPPGLSDMPGPEQGPDQNQDPPGPDGPPDATPTPGPSDYDPAATVVPVGYLIDEANDLQVPLTATTIIGSNPGEDREAAAGFAGMITVDDPNLRAVHVRLRIDGNNVTAEDTVGGGSWIQTGTESPVALTLMARTLNDGDVLRVGAYAYTFRDPLNHAGA